MGYSYLPDKNDERVCCQVPCKHTDCNYWKNLDTTCTICGKEILPGKPIYQSKTDPKRFDHEFCVIEEKLEENQ